MKLSALQTLVNAMRDNSMRLGVTDPEVLFWDAGPGGNLSDYDLEPSIIECLRYHMVPMENPIKRGHYILPMNKVTK